jgi:phosphoglycolate phosphatase
MRDLKALLFDFDGTLACLNIDFADMARKIHELMDRWGLDHGMLKERYILEQIQEAADHMGSSWSAFREEAMNVLLEVEARAAAGGKLLPGVRPLLHAIRQMGFRVGILTRNCRKAVLAVAPDLEAYCDAFVPRDDTIYVKPHPEHLRICLKKLDVHPRYSMMVGDHVIDVHSGQAVGMRTIGVLTGNTSRWALEEAGADLVVEDVTCLASFLGLA